MGGRRRKTTTCAQEGGDEPERAAAEAAAFDAAAAQAQQLIAKGDVSISRAAGEDGGVEAVSAQDVQQLSLIHI